MEESARLILAFANGSALETAATDALMVMPSLILQRSSVSLSHRQRVDHVERRLQQWFNGNFEELRSEGRAIQEQLRLQERKSRRLQVDEDDHLARTFARQLNGGKVKGRSTPFIRGRTGVSPLFG